MKRRYRLLSIIFTFGILLLTNAVEAQSTKSDGLLQEDTIKLKRIPLIDFQVNNRTAKPLPAQYSLLAPFGELPLTSNCSSVGQAIAIAYAIHYAKKTAECEGKAKWIQFSASFIYNQIKRDADCMAGTKISDGLALVQEVGICPETQFPSRDNSCQQLPSLLQLQQSSSYKIQRYQELSKEDSLPSTQDDIIDQIKKALYTNHPVIIGIQWPLRSTALLAPLQAQGSKGCEAMVITAYDKDVFEVIYNKEGALPLGHMLKIKQKDVAKNLLSAFIMLPSPCSQ